MARVLTYWARTNDNQTSRAAKSLLHMLDSSAVWWGASEKNRRFFEELGAQISDSEIYDSFFAEDMGNLKADVQAGEKA